MNYYEQVHTNKLGNIEEMDKFLETYILPRWNHEKMRTYGWTNNEKEN